MAGSAEYKREWLTKRRGQVEADPQSVKAHGTRTAYTYGCRCDVCRHAHTRRSREWRARRRELAQANPDSISHGRASSYANLGCRCEACTRAAREAQRVQIARRPDLNVASTQRYVERASPKVQPKSGQLWTGAEMEVATAKDADGAYLHTAADAAGILGRSLVAVARIRQRCASDPKYIKMLGAGRE